MAREKKERMTAADRYANDPIPVVSCGCSDHPSLLGRCMRVSCLPACRATALAAEWMWLLFAMRAARAALWHGHAGILFLHARFYAVFERGGEEREVGWGVVSEGAVYTRSHACRKHLPRVGYFRLRDTRFDFENPALCRRHGSFLHCLHHDPFPSRPRPRPRPCRRATSRSVELGLGAEARRRRRDRVWPSCSSSSPGT